MLSAPGPDPGPTAATLPPTASTADFARWEGWLTSTWPVLRLRWKFVESSQASHRLNSIAEKTDKLAGVAR